MINRLRLPLAALALAALLGGCVACPSGSGTASSGCDHGAQGHGGVYVGVGAGLRR